MNAIPKKKDCTLPSWSPPAARAKDRPLLDLSIVSIELENVTDDANGQPDVLDRAIARILLNRVKADVQHETEDTQEPKAYPAAGAQTCPASVASATPGENRRQHDSTAIRPTRPTT